MSKRRDGTMADRETCRPARAVAFRAGVVLALGLAFSFEPMAAQQARKGGLAAEIEAAQDVDVSAAPKETAVRMQRLLDRADKDSAIGIEARAQVRIKLAAAYAYSGTPDRALQELDAIVLELGRAGRNDSE
jgi:hypothetical protein